MKLKIKSDPDLVNQPQCPPPEMKIATCGAYNPRWEPLLDIVFREIFPELNPLSCIELSIPLSTFRPEWGFSILRHVETKQRSRQGGSSQQGLGEQFQKYLQVKSHNGFAIVKRKMKYTSQHYCDNAMGEKWPYIANVIFRIAQNYGE